MSFPFPPENLITIEGILVAVIVYFFMMRQTRKEVRSKQSWIPALIFALMAEIAVSLLVKGL